jgi:Ser/Thr protein kinase RdoA (MazF antagonist)
MNQDPAITPTAAELPFARLAPATILDAVESAGLRCDGRLLALNSYENRVYQVGLDDGPFVVVKFYRPQRWSNEAIQEEHDFLAELVAEEIPVVAPQRFAGASLLHHEEFRFTVFPRAGGRAPELGDATSRAWMGRLLARIHQVGARRPFIARPTLDLDTFGREPVAFLLAGAAIPAPLRSAYRDAASEALAEVAAAYERVGPLRRLRLHGDCYPGNVLWTDEGPHFVDFDDARMGPAIQDLWMLAPDDPAALAEVIEGYEQMRPFEWSELALVDALRTLRLIHHSAWLARRWHDPAFPAAFPWFATPRYWEERVAELHEQAALLRGEPADADDAGDEDW